MLVCIFQQYLWLKFCALNFHRDFMLLMMKHSWKDLVLTGKAAIVITGYMDILPARTMNMTAVVVEAIVSASKKFSPQKIPEILLKLPGFLLS